MRWALLCAAKALSTPHVQQSVRFHHLVLFRFSSAQFWPDPNAVRFPPLLKQSFCLTHRTTDMQVCKLAQISYGYLEKLSLHPYVEICSCSQKHVSAFGLGFCLPYTNKFAPDTGLCPSGEHSCYGMQLSDRDLVGVDCGG